MTTSVLQAPSLSYALSKVQTAYGDATIDATGLVTVDSRAVNALLGAGFTMAATRQVGGSHLVTSGEAAANAVVLATGLGTVTSMTVQVLSNTNVVATSDAVVTKSAGNVTVADGATYNTVAGYIINWTAQGY